ncbi:MAG: O-antigen ligase family protein [Mesorhizobium sp.]
MSSVDIAASVSARPRRQKAPSSIEDSPIQRIVRYVCLGLLGASVLIVLLTHGGVYPAAIAISLILMCASLAIGYVTLGVRTSVGFVFHFVLGVWAVVFAWSLIQSMPLPETIQGHPAWEVLRELGLGEERYLSPAPANVRSALLPISLPFAGLLTALVLLRTDEEVGQALRTFSMVGGLLALFAIGQFVAFPNALMFGEKIHYLGSLTAPFVNRNTAATFYGVTLLSLLCQFRREQVPFIFGSGKTLFRAGVSVRWVATLTILAVAAFVALALTTSRAGVAASAIGVVVFAAGMFVLPPPPKQKAGAFPSAGRQRPLLRLLLAVLLLASIAATFWLLAGRASLRAEIQGLDDGRFCVLAGILQAIRDNWLTGIGAGVFPVYFPAYRDAACGISGQWEMAHNFYLDAQLALGIIFVPILLSVVAVLAVVLRRGILNRRRNRPIVWAGIASCVIVALHSTVDFSIQIPGFSLWWALFLAMVLQVCTSRTKIVQ